MKTMDVRQCFFVLDLLPRPGGGVWPTWVTNVTKAPRAGAERELRPGPSVPTSSCGCAELPPRGPGVPTSPCPGVTPVEPQQLRLQ